VVYLLPFLFVLHLFNFLNKRNRSDFYHALPVSRIKLYLSFLAAALTWIWGIGLIVLALGVITSLIGGTTIAFATVVASLGLFFTASLFAAAATLVAVSITGTRFSNLVVTALIVFLPHLVASCFAQSIVAVAPNIPAGYVGLVSGVQIKNTFFMTSPFLVGLEATPAAPVSNVVSILVTLLWSVILIASGCWFFFRRPSESAGKSAPSKRLQLLYRVAVGALVVAFGMWTVLGISSALGPGLIIGDPEAYGSSVNLASTAHIGSFVAVLVVALVIFIVFELITTRRWIRIAHALPSFAFVLVFAVAFYGAILLYSSYETNFKPQAAQIASVRLLSAQYGMDSMNEGASASQMDSSVTNDGPISTYNQLLLQQTNIKDTVFLRAAADKLRESFPAEAVYGNIDENHTTMLIEVTTKNGRTAYRLVNVRTGAKPDVFNRTMLTTPEVVHALLALPPLDNNSQLSTTVWMSGDNLLPTSSMTEEQSRQARELYTVFKSEYEALSPQEQYHIIYGYSMGTPPAPSGETTTVATFTGGSNLDFSGVLGGKAFSNSYMLITPQASAMGWKMTCAELKELLAKRTSGLVLDQLDLYTAQTARAMASMDATDSAAPSDPSWSVMSGRYAQEMNGGDTSDSESMDMGYPITTLSDVQMSKVLEIVRPALARDFALNAPYYAQMTYGQYDRQGNEFNQNTIMVPLTIKEAAELQALTKK